VITITPQGRQVLLQLLARRRGASPGAEPGRRPAAPGQFLRLHSVTRTGLLGVVLDRPRATDRTLELGEGELLLVEESLARAVDGFMLDRDERGGIAIRAASARSRRRRSLEGRRQPAPTLEAAEE
jgi:hypothetical protein